MYAWSSRGRLCPMRMVWFDRRCYLPKYELVRMARRRSLRAFVPCYSEPKVAYHRLLNRSSAGVLGDWPVHKYGRRKKNARDQRF